MDQILTSFGFREMTAAGLKKTMFCLSYMHPAVRQVKHIKCYQNYHPKLRRNIGAAILTDQILNTHMNVPGMEPTYASCKEAHVLIQGDQRVMQPIPDTFCLSKNKLH
jgi:hypothetical protein